MVAEDKPLLNGVVWRLKARILPHCLIINSQIKPAGLEVIVADDGKRAIEETKKEYPCNKESKRLAMRHALIILRD